MQGQINGLATFSQEDLQNRIQDMRRNGFNNGDIAGTLSGVMQTGTFAPGPGGPGPGGPGGGGPGGGAPAQQLCASDAECLKGHCVGRPGGIHTCSRF